MSARARHRPWFRDPADFEQRCEAQLAGEQLPGVREFVPYEQPFEPLEPLPPDAFKQAFEDIRTYVESHWWLRAVPMPPGTPLRSHYSNRP